MGGVASDKRRPPAREAGRARLGGQWQNQRGGGEGAGSEDASAKENESALAESRDLTA